MAMRNLLLRNIMGSGTYSHHAYEAYRTLRATGQDINQMAVQLADFPEDEMGKDIEEPSKMVDVFAPQKRKQGKHIMK